jgi:hypothetical protein
MEKEQLEALRGRLSEWETMEVIQIIRHVDWDYASAAVRREKVSNACCGPAAPSTSVMQMRWWLHMQQVNGHVCAGGGVQRNKPQQNSRSSQPSLHVANGIKGLWCLMRVMRVAAKPATPWRSHAGCHIYPLTCLRLMRTGTGNPQPPHLHRLQGIKKVTCSEAYSLSPSVPQRVSH